MPAKINWSFKSLNLPPNCKHAVFSLVEPLSSVSSLEVHFDLLDLTELTDMSDQELAEVFADSDEENHNESPAGKVCWNWNTCVFAINNINEMKGSVAFFSAKKYTSFQL